MNKFIPSIYLLIGIIQGYLMSVNVFFGTGVGMILITITAIALSLKREK